MAHWHTHTHTQRKKKKSTPADEVLRTVKDWVSGVCLDFLCQPADEGFAFWIWAAGYGHMTAIILHVTEGVWRVEFRERDLSLQQFDQPRGLLLPILYELRSLVTIFASRAEKDLWYLSLKMASYICVDWVDTAVKQCALREEEKPRYLVLASASLVKYKKWEMQEMGKEIALLSLTITGWLMVRHFEADGILPGLVPFKRRETAFAHFQTAILSKTVCDDWYCLKGNAEVMTDVMGSNVHCN